MGAHLEAKDFPTLRGKRKHGDFIPVMREEYIPQCVICDAEANWIGGIPYCYTHGQAFVTMAKVKKLRRR